MRSTSAPASSRTGSSFGKNSYDAGLVASVISLRQGLRPQPPVQQLGTICLLGPLVKHREERRHGGSSILLLWLVLTASLSFVRSRLVSREDDNARSRLPRCVFLVPDKSSVRLPAAKPSLS